MSESIDYVRAIAIKARHEKTKAIIEAILSSIDTYKTNEEWIRETILFGRVGLANMTDDEIDTEHEFWVGDIDEEIDERALAHEAATNNT